MPRGPLSQETREQRAKKIAEEFLGHEIEIPLETLEDKMREAQSVINFFEVKGTEFKKEQCRNCEGWFAYSYHIDGIKHCSVMCAAATLKKMGLTWDPTRPAERRWGLYAPAVVPSVVLEILRYLQLDDIPEDQTESKPDV